MTQTVLILGRSGKIGRNATIAFKNAGWVVRQYDRTVGDMVSAAKGADVIVNGLNPQAYHDWATLIPQITAQVIAAAQASGATVIIPGNIYNFGYHPGKIDEHTPKNPNTRKGRIRVTMEQAYAESGVQTIILRAGNFIDPNSDSDVMSLMITRDIRKGKITAVGGADVMQAYCFLPDWARAAVMLAERRGSLEKFEDVPFPGHAFTTTELRHAIARATQKPMRITSFPWWIMRLLSPFWELARELREMRYLFDMPHWISNEKFTRLLPEFKPTSLENVMLDGLPHDIYPDEVVRPSGQAIVAE